MIEFTAWDVYAYENESASVLADERPGSQQSSKKPEQLQQEENVIHSNNRFTRVVLADHLPQVSEKGLTFESFCVEADKGVFGGRHDGAILHWPISQEPSVTVPYANTMRGHTGAVLTLDFAPDLGPQGLLFSGSADRSIKVWDPWGSSDTPQPTRNGYACVQTLSEHCGSVVSVRAMPQQNNGLVSCSLDRTVKTWYPAEGRALLLYPWYLPAQSISQPGSSWPSACCVRDGANGTLFVGDSAGCISVYTHSPEDSSLDTDNMIEDVDEGVGDQLDVTFHFRLKRKFSHFHSLGISTLQMVADNCFVVSLGFDEKAQVIDAISGALSATICSASAARFISCSWDDQGNMLLLGDAAGYIHMWNIFEDKISGKTRMFETAPLSIISLHVLMGSPAGDFILTGLANGVKQWMCNRNVGYVNCSGHTDAIVSIAVINTNVDISPEHEAALREKGARRGLLTEDERISKSCQFFSASLDGSIRCWDSYDMKMSYSFEERHLEISCMIASTQFQRIFTGHDGGVVKIWSVHSGLIDEVSAEGQGAVTCLVSGMIRDQEVLVAGSVDGRISIWEVNYDRISKANPFSPSLLHDKHEEITCLAFSKGEFLAPHGQEVIIVGFFTGQIAIWSFSKRATLCVLKAHSDALCSLAVHGCLLFSSSEDTLLRMWNMCILSETYELGVLRPPNSFSSSGSGSPIVSLDVIPLRGIVLSAASDGSLIAWDYTAFEDENAFDAYGKIVYRANIEGSVKCLQCWPEHKAMICGTTEGKLLVFDLPPHLFDPPRRELLKAGRDSSITS